MTPSSDSLGFTLDAGTLIAYEKGSAGVMAVLRSAEQGRLTIAVPARALAQAWRNGRTRARLARFLRAGSGTNAVPTIEPLSATTARKAGELCGSTGTSDVVDASVVLCAWLHRHSVVTSDPYDLRTLAPQLRLIVV